jgi:hypothetical protein
LLGSFVRVNVYIFVLPSGGTTRYAALKIVPNYCMRKIAERSSDALDTGFMKAENVVAALIYDEGNGTW